MDPVFSINDIFPSAPQGLRNIGFLFGAGTSCKAGYPLMTELTQKVLSKLDNSEYDFLNNVITRTINEGIDKGNGTPNIEAITDILEDAIIRLQPTSNEYLSLIKIRSSIKAKIFDVMNEIESPNLEDHILFFSALHHIFEGRSGSEAVWIFTPNYDLLFELAASHVGVPLVRGFLGSALGYFNIQSLSLKIGFEENKKFSSLSQSIFKLIKLHGSIDWWKSRSPENSRSVFSTQNPKQIQYDVDRVMVMPQRKKVRDTLEYPFSEIFRFSERILGNECKFLVSCGYSYGDEHINDTLLLPKLKEGKIKLVGFLKEDSPNLEAFKKCAPFSFGTEAFSKKAGFSETGGTTLWEFEKLVDLLIEFAGIRRQ